MKYLIIVPDGMSDLPEDFEGGATPLSCAVRPVMDHLADHGEVGWAETVPEGMDPGSDVAALSIFGFSPKEHYTGRAPLEAASLGVEIGDGVAYRCNLVTIRDGVMEDFTAGHISSPEAAELVQTMNDALAMDAVSFHAGVSYRHIMLAPAEYLDADCVPPHDIIGRPISDYLPQGHASGHLRDLMEWSKPILADHPVNRRRISVGKRPATQIWLWGQGRKPALPTFRERLGLTGSVVTAVDLIKGIGRLVGLRVPAVKGATGFVDTNYEGKADAALDALESGNFVYIHIEAPDEAGHMGDATLKRRAIEDFDRRFLKRVLDGLTGHPRFQPYRLLLLPDHPTPIRLKTHIRHNVPYLLFDSRHSSRRARAGFTELSVARRSACVVPGHMLVGLLLERESVPTSTP